jgi:hypothetical protein
VWTEEDDEEIEYGKLYDYTLEAALAEQDRVHPPRQLDEIWPHWSEGVPTKLRVRVRGDAFHRGLVYHLPRYYYASVKLMWNAPQALSLLQARYSWLPSAHKREWSGVYRIFSPNTIIDRCCGRDPTGTLYIGRAGTGGRNWSVLRTRIMSIVTGEHHAIRDRSDLAKQKFPFSSLSVEWACTGETWDDEGEAFAEAILAERWLLSCYNDSYGEYPPWNQRG